MSYSLSPCRLGADSHPLLHTWILHMFSDGSVCLPLVTVLVYSPCGARRDKTTFTRCRQGLSFPPPACRKCSQLVEQGCALLPMLCAGESIAWVSPKDAKSHFSPQCAAVTPALEDRHPCPQLFHVLLLLPALAGFLHV